ncbi:PucR family transcriptional regulator [Phaeacidiphilus oryzae]|uniref:PucR family transcriptional regulator n=1 Tax=Phaeacidiphilus oryzae TaxID=348818 RepID=UPI0009FE5F7C|nr:helix-turn-helix domain-containing protein [Phaeacidiphilus oryzae]
MAARPPADEPPPSTTPAHLPSPGGISLRHLLLALGEALVETQAAPQGLDVGVRGLALLDPEDPPLVGPGELVLAIGVRGRAALPAIRAAGRARAAGVAVRSPAGEALREAAEEAGVALLSVPPGVRWEQLHTVVRSVLDHPDPHTPGLDGDQQSAGGSGAGADAGDLFSLAQTTAVLTRGIVSIEDSANRVLAYSRSSDQDEVDDLRRLSILGWQGPEPYLAQLRAWGVFQRLRSSDEVIPIDDHPELGIRRRLVVAIRAGHQLLGTIWVQEGAQPLAERSSQVLEGAARVAALHLVRRRREVSGDLRLTQTLLTGLLEGSTGPQSLSTHLGLDQRRPAAVLGFAPAPTESGASPALARTEITNLISVQAAARHPSALVAPIGARVYALLPDLPRSGPATHVLVAWAQEIADAARTHLDVPLRGAVGRTVPQLADTPDSRLEADRILDAMASGGVDREVAALPDVQAEVLVREILALLADRPSIRDPRLTALTEYDARHRSRLSESVLAYLDAFGDVRTAADRLHIHPNTLRYRLRRAESLTGLDLTRPEQRLLTTLQLRLPT